MRIGASVPSSQISRLGWLGRLVVRRALADRGLLAPAFVSCLLATTLIASGPILAAAVATAGVRQTVRDAAPTAANLRLSAPLHDVPLAELDDRARRAISGAMSPPGAVVEHQLRSGSFALHGRDELVRFAWAEGVTDHLTVVAGRWPARRGAVAVPEPVAAALGWSVGDRQRIADTRTGEAAEIDVAAVFRVTDPAALHWWGAPPDHRANWERGGFVIYGPLLTDRATMTGVLGAVDAWWTARLAVNELDASNVDELSRDVADLARRSDDDLNVDTGLPALLTATGQRLLAARAGALTVVLQLFLLAVYALALAARLVLAERAAETALLRSRGTRPRQLAAVAAAEALLITLPAMIAGPLLARFVVGLLDSTGALARADLVLEPTVTPAAIALATIAGLITVVALTAPALATATNPTRGRQRRTGVAQRAGIDLALLALAGLGYWQLRRAGGPVTAGIRGGLGLDPLLVVAPALCLLAGAVLTLRAVPLLARLGERAAVAGRQLVPALGAWQIARRPRAYARAALLPVLALALGLFAASYGRTWDAAQTVLAAQQAGADLLVTPSRAASIAPVRLSGTYSAIGGVAAAVPALLDTTTISGEAGAAEILALDATGADRLAISGEVADMTTRLADRPPRTPAVAVPDTSALTLRIGVTPLAHTRPGPPARIALLLRDRHGLVHRLPAGELPIDGTSRAQRIDLRGVAAPAAIAGLEMGMAVDAFEGQSLRVMVDRVDVARGAPLTLGTPRWSAQVARGDSAEIITQPVAGSDGTALELQIDVPPSAAAGQVATVVLLAGQLEQPGAVGVLVTERFAAALGVEAGDLVPLRIDGTAFSGQVAAIVPTFPTMTGHTEAGGVIMDIGTLAALRFADGRRIVEPTSWLLDTDGDPAAVAQQVSAAPLLSDDVLDRAALTRQLRSDPVALGVIAALSLGFAAASVLAALGLVVTASAAVRERVTEFALLRAIGLSSGQLVSLMTLEHGLLLTGALAGGVLLGGAMSWLVLPYTALDATGIARAAGVDVETAWTDVIGLVAFLLGAVGVTVLLLARPLRRLRLGTVLRAGDER